MYISGHLHTDEKYTRALPNDAIVTEGTKSFIFILDKQALEKHVGEENHEGHEHGDEDDDDAAENKTAFRMVEVIPGLKDEGYTEIRLINPLPENTQVVMNAAYYLLADMKKEETEHEH
jgi:cobalt-zinc-cadmium efflux system membrane fusion protein